MPYFFATRNDILPVLRGVEKTLPVKYVAFEDVRSPNFEEHSRGEDIPNLGIAPQEPHANCPIFLICDPALRINVRPTKGGEFYAVDQLHNPDTIAYQTGGLWKDILLYGSIGTCTASFSPISKKLLQRYTYQVRKHFKYIGAYYVGPEAEQMLKEGKRLTLAEQSHKSFDLQLPIE